MDVRPTALLFPACAAGALLAVRGAAALDGPGALAFATLVATGVAGVVVLLVVEAREARRARASLPAAAELLLRGTSSALGDAVVAFDAAGLVVWANAPAVALSGYAPEALLGRTRDALGEELSVLMRGLERGPAAGRVRLRIASGETTTVEAAAVRVPGPAAVDVAVLRGAVAGTGAGSAAAPGTAPILDRSPWLDAPSEVDDADVLTDGDAPRTLPPPIPAAPGADRQTPVRARAADALAQGDAFSLDAVSLRDELGRPLESASAAAAMLRLLLPGGQGAAAAQLARLEQELRSAQEAISALAEPLRSPAPRVVEVDAVVREVLAEAHLLPSIKVEQRASGERAVADLEQLHEALRRLVQLAAEGMPAGGVLSVRAGRRAGAVEIDLADTGVARAAPGGLELVLARRLVAAQGGRLQRAAMAGRGTLSRVALLPAPAPAPAPRRARRVVL